HVLIFSVLFHVTAAASLYTLSLYDALPILLTPRSIRTRWVRLPHYPRPPSDPRAVSTPLPDWRGCGRSGGGCRRPGCHDRRPPRSEEHTSELQSRENLVCRLLLEKKKKNRL